MLIPPLVKTLSLALSFEYIQLALIAITVRNEATLTYFLNEIGTSSFVHTCRLMVTRPCYPGMVLKTEEVAQDVCGDLLLKIPDQVDAELEVKIFKVTRAEDGSSPTNF